MRGREEEEGGCRIREGRVCERGDAEVWEGERRENEGMERKKGFGWWGSFWRGQNDVVLLSVGFFVWSEKMAVFLSFCSIFFPVFHPLT